MLHHIFPSNFNGCQRVRKTLRNMEVRHSQAYWENNLFMAINRARLQGCAQIYVHPPINACRELAKQLPTKRPLI